MLPLTLNCEMYMRFTNNFIIKNCKSNVRSMNIIMISLNLWNKYPIMLYSFPRMSLTNVILKIITLAHLYPELWQN